MGCGESVLVQQKLHAAGQGEKCKGFVWLAPSLPYPLQTADNPSAPPRELWDMIIGGLRGDRHAFVKASVGGTFGTHAGVEMGQESLQLFIKMIERNDIVAIERCVQILSRYDFTADLEWLAKNKGPGVPVVVVAGQDDNSTYNHRAGSALCFADRLPQIGLLRPVRSRLRTSCRTLRSRCGKRQLMGCTTRMPIASMTSF